MDHVVVRLLFSITNVIVTSMKPTKKGEVCYVFPSPLALVQLVREQDHGITSSLRFSAL